MGLGGTHDKASIRRLLRQAGLRATSARVATYGVLATAGRPLTHAEVVRALEGSGVERTTVYRNLMDLAEVELVARSDLGDHAWRFELKDGHDHNHCHFVCIDCGQVSCLEGVQVVVDEAVKGPLPDAVGRNDIEVQLRGRCDACV